MTVAIRDSARRTPPSLAERPPVLERGQQWHHLATLVAIHAAVIALFSVFTP